MKGYEEYSKDSLDVKAKVRYVCKRTATHWPYYLFVQAIFGSLDWQCLLENSDIVVYLLQTPWKYTQEKLKANKSLEVYNYFVSDWVGTCYYHKINSEFCVIKAAVRPSQRLSEKPHRPWVGLRQKDGSICATHCTCMIWLGKYIANFQGSKANYFQHARFSNLYFVLHLSS